MLSYQRKVCHHSTMLLQQFKYDRYYHEEITLNVSLLTVKFFFCFSRRVKSGTLSKHTRHLWMWSIFTSLAGQTCQLLEYSSMYDAEWLFMHRLLYRIVLDPKFPRFKVSSRVWSVLTHSQRHNQDFTLRAARPWGMTKYHKGPQMTSGIILLGCTKCLWLLWCRLHCVVVMHI